jgi:tetratricopeptide (TPR) repeat protein
VVIAGGVLGGKMTPAFAIRSASNFTRAEYLRSELPAIWHYIRLFLLPIGQSGDPDYPTAASFLEPRVIAAGLGLLALLIFTVCRLRQNAAALAVGWFLVCIFPASSIFPLAEIVNEHRPYIAAAALCVLAAAALVRVPQKARLAVTLAVLVPLAAATVMRNRAWHNEETLWADVVQKSPGSTRAQMNYGLALMSTGRLAEAEPHLREAVRLGPRYAYAYINLGSLLLAQGHADDARRHLDEALRWGPDLFWAHYFRGLAAERLGEPTLVYFEATARLSPNFAAGWYHLSLARDAAGNTQGALAAAREAVRLENSYDDRYMVAYLLLKLGDARGAKPILDELHAQHPEDAKVNHNLDYARSLLK